MALLQTVLEIVAPVFLLGLVGFAWIKLGFEYRLQFVTRLAMTLSVPCLIFVTLMEADIDPQALRELSIAAASAYGILTVIMLGLVAIMRESNRTYTPPLIFGNTGNVGLPLALFAFGDAGLSYAVVIFAVMAIWSFTFGVWMTSGGGSIVKSIQEPMVAATVLGVLFLWQGWQTPVFLTNTLSMVGQMAIPLMLITLGVAVARLHPGRLGFSLAISAIKIAICVAVAWGVGRWFALDPVPFAVLVLQVATPVAVTSYMLAEKFGADSDAVASLVVTSTLLSIPVLPVLLAVLI